MLLLSKNADQPSYWLGVLSSLAYNIHQKGIHVHCSHRLPDRKKPFLKYKEYALTWRISLRFPWWLVEEMLGNTNKTPGGRVGCESVVQELTMLYLLKYLYRRIWNKSRTN